MIPSGRRMLTLLLGSVEVIVVTGSTSGVPLALSTRTIFALTIRFRYVAEITRFSSSTKLIAECMRIGIFEFAVVLGNDATGTETRVARMITQYVVIGIDRNRSDATGDSHGGVSVFGIGLRTVG